MRCCAVTVSWERARDEELGGRRRPYLNDQRSREFLSPERPSRDASPTGEEELALLARADDEVLELAAERATLSTVRPRKGRNSSEHRTYGCMISTLTSRILGSLRHGPSDGADGLARPREVSDRATGDALEQASWSKRAGRNERSHLATAKGMESSRRASRRTSFLVSRSSPARPGEASVPCPFASLRWDPRLALEG